MFIPDDTIDVIKRKVGVESLLEKSAGGGYVCPVCNSGRKVNRTGAVGIIRSANLCRCFSCDTTMNPIQVYQRRYGADFRSAVLALADAYGVPVDGRDSYTGGSGRRRTEVQQAEKRPKADVRTEQEEEADYEEYYRACRAALRHDAEAVAYLTERGISLATAWKYWLGYDRRADPCNDPGGTGSSFYPRKRIIIPCSRSFYVTRAISADTPKAFEKANSRGNNNSTVFNGRALYGDALAVFIVEGAFDALSVVEAGGVAVGLNSTGNVGKLLKILEENPTQARLVLALDADNAGRRATEKLRDGLGRLGIRYTLAGYVCGDCKDENEFFTRNRNGFIEAVAQAEREAMQAFPL